MQTKTNQSVLFEAIRAVVLRQESDYLAVRRETTLPALKDVEFVGTTNLTFRNEKWKLIPGTSFDWALMPVENDPLYLDPRGFPMPEMVIRRLKKMRKAGVDFDAIWVAHEIRKGKREGQSLTVEDLLPIKKGAGNESFIEMAKTAFSILSGQDPILFGVNTMNGVSDLFVLGVWSYDAR